MKLKISKRGKMALDINKSVKKESNIPDKLNIMLVGEPMSGKSTQVDQLPNCLVLTTDGNQELLQNADYFKIAGFNTQELKERKIKFIGNKVNYIDYLRWIEDVVDELTKSEYDKYEYIVVDLLADVMEVARQAILQALGIEYEDEKGFGKGWLQSREAQFGIAQKFLTLKQNIIFLAHSTTKTMKARGIEYDKQECNFSDKLYTQIASRLHAVPFIMDDYTLSLDQEDRSYNVKCRIEEWSGKRFKDLKSLVENKPMKD